jgi:hypothetical protein
VSQSFSRFLLLLDKRAAFANNIEGPLTMIMWDIRWGFLQTGSGVPHNQLPLVSRSLDLAYESIVCADAFNIHNPPDINTVNKYGGFNINYERLAIVGGQADPWRPSTPLADNAPKRHSTTDKPVILIQGAVHHCTFHFFFYPYFYTLTLGNVSVAD